MYRTCKIISYGNEPQFKFVPIYEQTLPYELTDI